MLEQLKNLLVNAGAMWVIWLLAGLSVASIAIMIDRARVFWAKRDDIATLVQDLQLLLSQRDLDGARTRLSKSPSVAAAVATAGLARWAHGSEAVKEAMAAATGLERGHLDRRLLFLGTVGNNAPFIGLLGTVIGVVGAFEELGRASTFATAATQLAPERVMSTIAEALVATAVGLVVAIPAVGAYNYFQGLLATTFGDAETLGHVLLGHVGAEPRAESGSAARPDPASASEGVAASSALEGL
jgi:biopolymer transport protein ExbB